MAGASWAIALSGVAVVGLAGGPSLAGDWRLDPSLWVGAVYDDNLFSSPAARERDVAARVTPGLAPAYRSARLAVSGRYAVDAEAFDRHPRLNSWGARQETALTLQARPGRALELGGGVAFIVTHSPGELNQETGLSFGRARATRLTLSPRGAWRAGRRTAVEVQYRLERDALGDGPRSESHVATGAFRWRATARSSTGLSYEARLHRVPSRRPAPSHTLLVRWGRDVGRWTRLDVAAGPRWEEGAVDAALDLSIRRRLRAGALVLAAARGPTTALGHPGTITTDSVSVSLSVSPARRLQVGASAAAFRNRSELIDAAAYQVRLGFGLQLSSWLSAVGSHQLGLQRGGPAGPSRLLVRNVATFGFAVGPSRDPGGQGS